MGTSEALSEPLEADFLIHPEWLVPMTEKGRILNGYSVAIGQGKILAIDTREALKSRYQPQREIDLPNQVLIPGLINAHGHSPMSLFRGYADDISLQPWLEEKIWPAEGRWVSEEFVRDGATLAIAEMLLSGTTAFTDMYFFPDEIARAALGANIRVQLASPILDFPTIWAQDADEYIRKTTELSDRYKNNNHIQVAFGPHAPYTVSDAPLQHISTLANELDLPIHIHVHENAQEIELAVKQTGIRPLQRLEELGLISQLLQCVHATQLTEAEIELLASNGATVIHCPASNAKLASGQCPASAIMAAGINLCLGTDSAASNNELNMIQEMRLAALFGKITAGDAAAMSAWDVLEMATINGARAMGKEETLGTLETGKCADCVAIDLGHLNSQPTYDPVATLVYSARATQVSHVWVDGKLNVEQGELLTLDKAELLAVASRWQHKIL